MEMVSVCLSESRKTIGLIWLKIETKLKIQLGF